MKYKIGLIMLWTFALACVIAVFYVNWLAASIVFGLFGYLGLAIYFASSKK